MSCAGNNFNPLFLWDRDWQLREELIKRDPYRYIKSRREEKRCWRRPERFVFIYGLFGLYTYKHFRYHNELGRVKRMKFTVIGLYSWYPRALMLWVFLYPMSIILFKDHIGIKSHQIAKIELQKFDKKWFKYDDFAYVVHNAPIYKDEDSVFGRLYVGRLLRDFYQVPGWIRRLREQNSSIENDVPPNYAKTPKGPRKTNFDKVQNAKPLWF